MLRKNRGCQEKKEDPGKSQRGLRVERALQQPQEHRDIDGIFWICPKSIIRETGANHCFLQNRWSEKPSKDVSKCSPFSEFSGA